MYMEAYLRFILWIISMSSGPQQFKVPLYSLTTSVNHGYRYRVSGRDLAQREYLGVNGLEGQCNSLFEHWAFLLGLGAHRSSAS